MQSRRTAMRASSPPVAARRRTRFAPAAWHMLSKAQGLGDPYLDDFVAKLTPEEQQKATALAHKWMGRIAVLTLP